MSIVGTRPPLISETNLYEPRHKARLAIKPGITGMWQVSGRSDITDFEEVVRLDKEYIRKELVGKLLETVREYGFEAKHFSSYGRKKMTACGMLGSKEPEKLASKKWLELNALADELIAKNV